MKSDGYEYDCLVETVVDVRLEDSRPPGRCADGRIDDICRRCSTGSVPYSPTFVRRENGEDREGESGLSMKRKGRERKSSGRREEAIRSDAIPTKMRILGALVPIRTSPIITKYGT